MTAYVDRVRRASLGMNTSVSLCLLAPLCASTMQREQFAQGLKPPSKLPLHSQHSGRQHSHSGFTPSLAPLGLRCCSSLAKCASVVASNQSFYIKFSCLESPLLLEILEIVAQMSLNCSTMKQNSSWKERTDWDTQLRWM